MASKIKQFSSSIGALLNENFGELSASAPKITQKKESQSMLAASAGKRKQVAILSVDPKKCRLWHLHNRDQDHLTEMSCKDLIDSIRLNGQLEPALVRELVNDADYDFEIIYGSRRKYACSVLRQDLQVRVTTANDRECAALMDAENRARKDISDYERALDYKRWLDSALYKTQKDLAEQIGMDTGNLNRLMKLTELPDFIIKAFKSPLEIKVHYAPVLLKLLNDKASKDKLYKKAWELKDKPNREGQKVFKYLVDATKTKMTLTAELTENVITSYSKQGEVLFTYKKRGHDLLEITINNKVIRNRLPALKAQVLTLIDAHFTN